MAGKKQGKRLQSEAYHKRLGELKAELHFSNTKKGQEKGWIEWAKNNSDTILKGSMWMLTTLFVHGVIEKVEDIQNKLVDIAIPTARLRDIQLMMGRGTQFTLGGYERMFEGVEKTKPTVEGGEEYVVFERARKAFKIIMPTTAMWIISAMISYLIIFKPEALAAILGTIAGGVVGLARFFIGLL